MLNNFKVPNTTEIYNYLFILKFWNKKKEMIVFE